ncbi:MAG: CHAD domain-containing protein, partial [Sedimenticola sp.]
MAEPPIHDYQIADSDGVDGIVFALSSRFHLGDEGEKVVRRTYYDTFDWRLYQAGAVFYEEKSSSGHWLVWRYLEAGRAKEMQRLDGKVPRYAGEFAPGLMRELVTPEISMRVLLPQVEVRSCVRLLIQYDQEEKTVLRVALEEHEARPPNKGKYAPLEATAQVVPIRGYPKPFERMSACLSSELKMQPLEREQMEAALAAIGRKPLDYSSKLNFKLQPQSRADAVARLIHLHLLAIMEVNLPGTRADLDSEFLHDFRVAVRRARSALTQVKEVFPREVLERYKEGFAWVGGVTGPTRDMDVYLLGYEDYRDSLQQQFRGSLEPLHHFLQIHQKSEHQAMVRKLNSPHF